MTNTNTWAKLSAGGWGVRVARAPADGAPVPGSTVEVVRRDGSKSTETITRVLSPTISDEGTWLCEVVAKPRAATTGATTQRPARPRSNWRPCGYPGCNPSYCDECDGEGFRSSYSGRRW